MGRRSARDRLVTRSDGNVLLRTRREAGARTLPDCISATARRGLPATGDAVSRCRSKRISRRASASSATITGVDEERGVDPVRGRGPAGHLRAVDARERGPARAGRIAGRVPGAAAARSNVGPVLVLAVSSAGRRMVLGERVEDEVEATVAGAARARRPRWASTATASCARRRPAGVTCTRRPSRSPRSARPHEPAPGARAAAQAAGPRRGARPRPRTAGAAFVDRVSRTYQAARPGPVHQPSARSRSCRSRCSASTRICAGAPSRPWPRRPIACRPSSGRSATVCACSTGSGRVMLVNDEAAAPDRVRRRPPRSGATWSNSAGSTTRRCRPVPRRRCGAWSTSHAPSRGDEVIHRPRRRRRCRSATRSPRCCTRGRSAGSS